MDSRELLALKKRLGLGATPIRSNSGGTAIISGLEAALAGRAALAEGNTFTGAQDVFNEVHCLILLSTDGDLVVGQATINAGLLTDPRTHQLPDASGILLVDAPSDGNKYVRKDGAWVLA